MNCIDAVEGTAKVLLDNFLDLASEYRLDASEYIRNVKAVIEGVERFAISNPEVSETPDLIRDELYNYAKKLWLKRLESTDDFDPEAGGNPDVEYQAYCYDYVFDHENYPR